MVTDKVFRIMGGAGNLSEWTFPIKELIFTRDDQYVISMHKVKNKHKLVDADSVSTYGDITDVPK